MQYIIKTVFNLSAGVFILGLLGCNEDDTKPNLEIPSSYVSTDYESNVTAEKIVIDELKTMVSDANDAESNAQSSEVAAITYPPSLSSVTATPYRLLVDGWLVELVKAANDDDGFQNPGGGIPADGEEGGLLGSRLLDENGLELEQLVEKGSFGAALYNHALTVINGDLTSASAIDKLVEIYGAKPSFDPSTATAAASYAKRRSNQTNETGFFYDIRFSLIAARAAIEAGNEYNAIRDQALNDFLRAWEKSNFATVIHYCNATKVALQSAGSDAALGDALHAYAEAVAFTHGFRGVSQKVISDEEIDHILELLLAPADETPESYRFLNDATLLINLEQVIEKIKGIYGFSEQEVNAFYINDPS